jgi:hypothetical protein
MRGDAPLFIGGNPCEIGIGQSIERRGDRLLLLQKLPLSNLYLALSEQRLRQVLIWADRLPLAPAVHVIINSVDLCFLKTAMRTSSHIHFPTSHVIFGPLLLRRSIPAFCHLGSRPLSSTHQNGVIYFHTFD